MATLALLHSATLVSQGAEAKVYKARLHPAPAPPIFVKHRFKKGYRHAALDAQLTRARVAGEARAIMKCLRAGVNVPGIRMVDAAEGVLGIEWVEGQSVRFLLGGGAEDEAEIEIEEDAEEESDEAPAVEAEDALREYGITHDTLMQLIGHELAKMHLADIVHGDLTTSNMMLRPAPAALVLIDFGLSYISTLVEDKAVDLYVLERAFASTHPDSAGLFDGVLKAYETRVGPKVWKTVKGRLDEVRLRGRKRSMVG